MDAPGRVPSPSTRWIALISRVGAYFVTNARISSSVVSGAMFPIHSFMSAMSASIFFGYVLVGVVRLAVALCLPPLRQFDLLSRRSLVWNPGKQVADDIQPRALLVVRIGDVPRRPGRVGRLEHLV